MEEMHAKQYMGKHSTVDISCSKISNICCYHGLGYLRIGIHKWRIAIMDHIV
jgi:hypothetical protein